MISNNIFFIQKKRLTMKHIWLPKIFYDYLPFLCIMIATISLFIPASFIKLLCIIYLYVYGIYIFYKRIVYFK